MKSYLLPFALILGLTVLSQGQEPDPAATKAATELVDSMDMEKLMTESLETSVNAQVQQFSQMGMKPAAIAEIKTEMLSFLKEVMAWKELRPDFIRIYAESFTAAELNELTAFYKTPTGKKAMSKMPELMQKGMMLGQEKVQARANELNERITPIIEKHMAAP